MTKQDLKKYLAELLGTGLLVFVACGVAVFSSLFTESGAPDLVATALAFGLTLMAIIYVIGGISGAHVNPAVSLAMAIRKKLSWKDFGFYALAQVIGAIVGGALLFGIVALRFDTTNVEALMGANIYGGAIDDINGLFSGLIFEIIATFAFVLTILGVTSKSENGKIAGIIIGFTLALVHLLGIGITGTSVNPARSLGVAVFALGAPIEQVWLFIVAPMAGGALAALAAMWLFKDKEEEKPKVKSVNGVNSGNTSSSTSKPAATNKK